MPAVTSAKLRELQQNTRHIRNICVLAHVDHGKTTLSDALLATNGIISKKLAGKMRYLDSREDEQERGITMESSGVSLYFCVMSPSKEADDGPIKQEYLINLIDSPGHVDFSSEVAAAARLSDGAFVLVDVIEGVCTQTVTVLYQAWIERIRPVLILNKIDRLITEWQMTAQEAYAHMQRLIEQVNAVLAGFWEEERLAKDSVLQQGTDAEQMKSAAMGGDQQDCLDDDSSIYFSPDQGNVLFASAFDGWAFGLSDFAKFYAPKLGIASPEKFCKALWGEFYFDPKNKKRILTRKQYAKTYGEGRAAAAQPLFVQLCLNNVWKVYDAILMHPDTDQVDKIIAALGVKILPRDRRSKDRRALLTAIMQGWLPLAQTCFLAAVEQLPSPIEAQARSLPALLHPESFVRFPHLSPDLPSVQPTDELERALYACDDGRDSGPRDGHPMPVVAFVSKMLAIERSSLPEFNVKSDRLKYTAEEMRARGRTALREEMIRMRQTGASGEQSPMPGVSDITTPDSVTSIPLSDQHQQDNEEGVANLSGAFESKLRVSPTPSQEEGAEAARGDGTIDMGEELVGFGRIYCGTLRVGDKIWAMQPKYDPSQPECTKSHVKQVTISALYMLMGRELVLLDHVPAGNVFAVRGLAGAILRTGTLSSRLECHNFGALQSPSAPIVRVALEPALPQDMPKLERGMRLLYQADPCVQVEFKATGEHILVTAGELHLERCLKDLRERFAKCQIHASEPIVPFREAIIPQPGQPGVAKREARSLRDIGDINMLISENGNVPLAQRGVVTVTTPNGLATITLQVEPLPHAVTQLLMKHNATIRSIVNSEPLDASPASQATSGDVTKDITDHNTAADAPRSEAVSGAVSEAEEDEEDDGIGLDVGSGQLDKAAWLREKLRRRFRRSRRWERRADKIVDFGLRSFGPNRVGPNLLIYDLPDNNASKYGPWYKPSIKPSNASGRALESLREKADEEFEEEDSLRPGPHGQGLLRAQDLEEPIQTAFQLSVLAGPLCAEPMVGIACTIKSIAFHDDDDDDDEDGGHEGPKTQDRGRQASLFGQVIAVVKDAIRQGFLAWSPRLLLAMYTCDIQAPTEVLGRVYGVISRRRGRIVSEDVREGTPYFIIKALLPVIESFGFADEIRSRTSGAASPLLIFGGFEMLDEDPFWVPTTEEELEDLGEKADRENLARNYMDAVRRRKGMSVERKLIEHAEKQRTLKK